MQPDMNDKIDDKIVSHPRRSLMEQAKIEREIVDSAEAEVLHEAIFTAVDAYIAFLHRHNILIST